MDVPLSHSLFLFLFLSSSPTISFLSPSYSALSGLMTKLLSVRSLAKQCDLALFIKHLYHAQRWGSTDTHICTNTHAHTRCSFSYFGYTLFLFSLSLFLADIARFVIRHFSLCHHGDLLPSRHPVMIGESLCT